MYPETTPAEIARLKKDNVRHERDIAQLKEGVREVRQLMESVKRTAKR